VTAVSGSAATATLSLTVTLEEAQVLAQALDLLASDPSRTAVRPLTSDEWPNIEISRTDDDNPALAALGCAAFDLSSRVHDLINAASTPSWVAGLRAVTGR
jgi:hypothetical protein